MMCPSCHDRQWGPCTCPLVPTRRPPTDREAETAFDFALWELEIKGLR